MPDYVSNDVMVYKAGVLNARACSVKLWGFKLQNTGWPKKTSRTLHNYNGAYTLWGEISFGTFVDQYMLLLTYKFQ